MGVYKYDAINDELIPIAGVPSVPGIEDKVSTYTADATYWDTSPTAASIKPVTSGGIKTEIDKKLSTYAVDSTAWDAAPTTASTKPVISDGIKTQFDLVHNELSDVNNILGSKNILPNSATTQVINGITYTVAADGSINANGTATADSILHIIPGTIGKLSAIFSKGGNYIISAGTTGSGVDFFFGLEYTGSTWDIAEWLTYSTRLSKEIYIDGTKLNNSSSYIESYIKVNSGTTVSNIKVYPMLRPSSVRDDTYVPYSKTNYELTTEISKIATLPEIVTNGNGTAYKFPSGLMICIKNLSVNLNINNAWGNLYESQQVGLGNWAVSFTSMPCMSVSLLGDNSGILENVKGASSSFCGNTWVTRPNTFTGAFIFCVIGIGSWK